MLTSSFKQDSPVASSDFSITEAKNYFEKNVTPVSCKGSTAIVTVTKSILQSKKNTQWGRAIIKKYKDRNAVVVVPLLFEENIWVLTKSGKRVTMGSMISVVMYKDNKDVIHTEVVKRIPDELREMHPKVFIGMVIVEDWDGNFIKGYQFLDGQINKLSYSGGQNSKHAKTSSLTPVCNKVGYRVCIKCVGGICGQWDYDTYCYNNNDVIPKVQISGKGNKNGENNNTGAPGVIDYRAFYDTVTAEINFINGINTGVNAGFL